MSRQSALWRLNKTTPRKKGLTSETNRSNLLQMPTHHVVVVVGAPEVRTVASTEVRFVAFGLMDPLPVEVTPEVDVERAQAAALVRAAETHKRHTLNQSWVTGKWPWITIEEPAIKKGNEHVKLPEFSPAAWGSLNKTLHACWPAV